MQGRVNWIDAMKGFGIIMVVYSHVHIDFGHAFLNSFKMPLFFFCSGYVANYSKYKRTSEFVKRRFVSLLYPYFIWSLMLFLFWMFFDRDDGDIFKNLLGIIYSSGGTEYMGWGVILWFLPALFIVEVLHAYIQKVSKVDWAIVGVSTIGYLYTSYVNKSLPWSFNISLIMLIFYHFGYVWKQKSVRFSNALYLPFVLVLWFVISYYNGKVLVYQGQINNPFLFLLGGLFGILSIKLLVQLFKKIENLLAFVGVRVILIFLVHLRLITVLKAIQLYVFHIPIHENYMSAIFYTVISVSILALAFDTVNKKLPWLLRYDK